jgi:hypothetical protein
MRLQETRIDADWKIRRVTESKRLLGGFGR